jgi:hypothetical protein
MLGSSHAIDHENNHRESEEGEKLT